MGKALTYMNVNTSDDLGMSELEKQISPYHNHPVPGIREKDL